MWDSTDCYLCWKEFGELILATHNVTEAIAGDPGTGWYVVGFMGNWCEFHYEMKKEQWLSASNAG